MGSTSLELNSAYNQPKRKRFNFSLVVLLLSLSFSSILYLSIGLTSKSESAFHDSPSPRVLSTLEESVTRCKNLNLTPRPPPNFHSRTRSDRYEPGSPPIVIRNATLWTGNDNGTEVLKSMDVFLNKGIISNISKSSSMKAALKDSMEIDAGGRWLTPGIIDMHVHLGVGPLPSLPASEDVNTRTAPITPYLRSLDGLNQHDLSFLRTMAGGVTTGLMLPGSGGNMGGQAFPIKLRSVKSHAPSDRVIEPPTSLALPGKRRADLDLDDSDDDGMSREDGSTSWRYMKMACGENARRFYTLTRMDEAYGFRTIFNRATILKRKQDDFCERTLSLADSYAKSGASLPTSTESLEFPDELELEAVVDILRGRVRVNTHCYTTTDLERMIAHTHEFKFNIAAFHHAHEAWLVPDLLKQTYGGTPAVAMFSANGNYKLEAYFGTPFAGPILQSHNITPIFKSDHPVTDSRRVLNQASQAHHFGLDEASSLRSVITAPAQALGLGHRIGFLNKGYDADVVLWNDHPLALGATPLSVIVDGVSQLKQAYAPTNRFTKNKDPAPQAPKSANYTSEIERVERDGTDIMEYRAQAHPTVSKKVPSVLLHNVGRIFLRERVTASDSNSSTIKALDLEGNGVAVLLDDKVVCSGSISQCLEGASIDSIPKGLSSRPAETIDLKGGDVLPGFTTFGSPLGLADIVSEASTQDGPPSDAFDVSAPARAHAAESLGLRSFPIARSVDGLRLWGSHDVQRAHSAGVTTAVVPPMGTGFIRGISVRFDTGAETPLDDETVRQEEVALHITLGKEQDAGDKPSISEQTGILSALFRKGKEATLESSEESVWSRVIKGKLPVVVETSSTSAIASLLSLIKPYPKLRLVISGATTASLAGYPKALAKANVAVLISPRTWAVNWEDLPSIPGPPLTQTNTLGVLLENGVKVGLQIEEAWQAGNALFDATWSAIDAGNLNERDVVALLTTNLDSILDLDESSNGVVAFDGPAFQYGSRPIVIGTPRGVEILP